jgi:dihydroorotase
MSGHDIVIKNGTVIDPSQGIHAKKDIAVTGGKIAALEDHIPDGDARDVIEAEGLIVTPGLVDLHVHVWWGVAHLAVEADPACLARGATTVVDAGSAGSNTFPGFHRYVISHTRTRIFAFLHISGMGQLDRDIGELEDIRWARVEPAVETARSHTHSIVGIKVRLSEGIVGANDIVALDKPLMIHIGGTKHSLEEIFGKLRPGDIVTHSFTPNPPGIITGDGKVLPAALEARQRGVVFDVGHGAGSFGFEVAEQAMEQDFPPATISSDVHRANIRGPVYDLATTLSKYLYLGIPLDEVIAMGTERPARAIGKLGEVGTLKPGADADVAVLRLREGPVDLTDARGVTRRGNRLLMPVGTLRAGRRFSPFHGTHPQHRHPAAL